MSQAEIAPSAHAKAAARQAGAGFAEAEMLCKEGEVTITNWSQKIAAPQMLGKESGADKKDIHRAGMVHINLVSAASTVLS